jgi:uncharacterized cofD-like protein
MEPNINYTESFSIVFLDRVRIFLKFGLGIKRWILTFVLGIFSFGFSIGLIMSIPLDPIRMPVFSLLVFSHTKALIIGAVAFLLGSILMILAINKAYKWILVGLRNKPVGLDIFTAVNLRISRDKGPKVVAIGGGTGQSTLLRGVKHWTNNLTAVVTITDDGGSSGDLRDDFDMPPPGDARNCLIALSDLDPVMEDMFLHRFNAKSSLDRHNVGNLFLAALYQQLGGFREVLEAAGKLLSISGRVIPVSNMTNLKLIAKTTSGNVISGESAIGSVTDPLSEVWIEPDGAIPEQMGLEAISEADIIVIGPGSLYTSIIPNFLIKGISSAVNESPATKIFVCNVATQPHETENYDVSKHLEVFQHHSGVDVDYIIVNNNIKDNPEEWNQPAVLPVSSLMGFKGNVIVGDVLDNTMPTRHDSVKLASAIMRIIH